MTMVPTSRPEDDTNEGGAGRGRGRGREERGGKGGGGKGGGGKCGRTTTNTTVWLMYKNECSFGYTITAFAALASIIPLGRKSEKVLKGMRRSGVANTVIVHPDRRLRHTTGLVRDQKVTSLSLNTKGPSRHSKSKNQTLLQRTKM